MTKPKEVGRAEPGLEADGRHGPADIDPQSEIGKRLRALYGAVEEETIPDRFLDLLEKLDEAERRHGKQDGAR